MENDLVTRAWELYEHARCFAKETDQTVMVSVRINSYGLADGLVTIGDYDFCVFPEGQRQINYNPGSAYLDNTYIRKVDPETIVSYTEPPKGKCPEADQSNQGKSVENNAHLDITTSGEEGQA